MASASSAADYFEEGESRRCSKCEGIFRAMSEVTIENFKPLRSTGIHVGGLQHISQSSDCHLCQFFYAMRFKERDVTEYNLMAWLPMQFVLPDHGEGYPEFPGRVGSILFGVTVDANLSMTASEAIRRSGDTGFIAMESPALRRPILTKWSDNPLFSDTPFYTRRVDPLNVNYGLLRHWIRSDVECEVGWSSYLNDEGALHQQLQATPIYVIDCSTRDIVMWNGDREFVALSYVWGSPGVNGSTSILPSHFPRPLPPQCPLVIEDSITVVKKLGLSYLWVDQYCIDQTNEVLKQAQISRMDLIYRWSKFTIIAAAGQDSTYGLPGVSRRPRLRQPSINISGQTLLATLADPVRTLQDAKWNTRGWTYQERFFSNLCLVFTDYQIFYECQDHEGYHCESTSLTLVHRGWNQILSGQRLFPSSDLNSSGGQFVIHPPQSRFKPAILISLETHVARYTSRDLTYDSDALIAFGAILTEFRIQGVDFLYGIPIRLQHNKTGSDGHIYDNHGISYGLCWTHGVDSSSTDNPPRRRQEFPSWSWAGWTGNVSWLPQATDSFHPCPLEDTEIEYKCGLTGQLCSLSALGSKSESTHYAIPKLLHVKAKALQLRFESSQPALAKGGSESPSSPILHFIHPIQPDARFCLRLTRQCGASDEDINQNLSTKTWLGIILGYGSQTGTNYILVVGKIHPGDDFLERIGIVQVSDLWLENQDRHIVQFWLG